MIFWNAFVSIHNYGFQIWLINQMETINGIKVCCIENVSMESTVIDYIIILCFLFVDILSNIFHFVLQEIRWSPLNSDSRRPPETLPLFRDA